MINWKVSKADHEVIDNIARRAYVMAKEAGIQYPLNDCVMDVTAAHLNGCRLKLLELLKADNCQFSHDVFGIRRHLNRENGQLEDCFVPRFAE